jgi:hypothetical protein
MASVRWLWSDAVEEDSDMKNQDIVALGIVVVSAFVVTVVVTAQSRDRFSLTSPNGIAFAEFKGYDSWQMIGTSVAGRDGCGSTKVGCMKAILANPVMVDAYRNGVPANGARVPDGAILAKVEWLESSDEQSPYEVAVPGAQTEVGFMIKDSKRFKDTDGWGYATLQYDPSAKTYTPKPISSSTMRTLCHECHTTGAKARDFLYTSYAQR